MRNQAEANLSALIESTEDLIWSVDLDYRLVTCNRALRQAFEKNFGVQTAPGMSPEELLPPAWAALCAPFYARALSEGSYRVEYSLPDGRTLEMAFNPIVVDGVTTGISIFGKDITDRKEAEESRRFHSTIVESSGDGIFAFSPDGTILTWNGGAAAISGYTAEEAIGRPLSMLVFPDRQPHVDRLVRMALEGHPIPLWQDLAPHKDGHGIHVSVTAWPIKNSKGEVTAVSVVFHDDSMRHAAEASKALLASIVESSDDAIYATDLDGTIVSWNRGAERMCGYTTEEIVGRHISVIIPPEERQEAREILEKLGRGESIPPFDVTNLHKDGSRIDVSLSISPVRNPAGEVVGTSGVARDISLRKRYERALQEAEKKYRDIYNGALEGMFQIAISGEVLSANPATARILGYDSPDELMSAIKDVKQDVWIDQEELLKYRQMVRGQDAAGILGFECQFKRKDGSIIWVSLNGRIVYGADGQPLYNEGFILDITGRKRAEETLREAAESLREAQRIAGLGSYELDVASGVWTSSAVMDEIFGIGEEYERTVAGWAALVHPQDRAVMTAYFAEEVLGKQIDFDKEYRVVRHADQAERWVHGLGRLEFDAQGRPLKMRGTIKDITGRKLTEIQLRDNEERYRETFEQAAVGILHTSFDGKIIRCNARFAETLGYPLEELQGMNFQQITAKEDLAQSVEVLERVQPITSGTAAWEKRYVRKNGSLTWVKLTVSIQRDAEGRALHYISVVEDINARKAAEASLAAAQESLRLSEAHYRTVFQTSLDGITISSLSDGRYIDVNQAFLNLTGYEREEIIGRTSVELGMWADASNREPIVEKLRHNSSVRDVEALYRKKNGELFWILISTSKIEIEGVPCLLSLVRDISAAKAADERLALAQQALQTSEERYRTTFQMSIDAVAINRLSDGVYIDVNRAFLSISGYEIQELIGQSSLELGIWADHGHRRRMVEELRLNSVCHNLDAQFRRKDGAVFWGLMSASIIEVDGVRCVLSVTRDISEAKAADQRLVAAQESLRASEKKFRTFFQMTVDASTVSRFSDGAYIEVNSTFLDSTGYQREEVIGRSAVDLGLWADLGDQRKLVEELRLNSVCHNLEARFRKKDGTLLWGLLSASIIEVDGASCALSVTRDISDAKAADELLATAQRALQTSEERYRSTFQMSIDGILITRLNDGMFVDANEAFLEFVGFEREEVVGRTSEDLNFWVHPEDRQRMVEPLLRDSVCRRLEAQFRKSNGEVAWGQISASVIEIGGARCVLSVVRNITDAKAAAERLAKAREDQKASEARYRATFEASIDATNINRLSDGVFIDVNEAFLKFTGYERQEVIGRTSRDLDFWVDPADRQKWVGALRSNSTCRDMEARFRRKNGAIVWGQASGSLIETDGVPCILSVTRDITDAKAAEDKIWNLAFYDPLTALPNRRLLLERLRRTLAASARSGHKRALLFVDLDNFKTLNDTLGHQTGDLMLQEVAVRLATCIRETDTVARLGGDEFVVMLEDLSDVPEEAASQAEAVGEKILAAIDRPFWLDGHECLSTSSIGITVFGDKRESTDEVLQQADIAMYQAKAAGRNTMRFFAPALQAAVNARAALEEDLRYAIKARQFELYFQPQVDCNGLIGVEALIRWNHPRRGLVFPDGFIPLAEETGLILPLGDWVLETACRQIAVWAKRPETAHISISVNISALQFRQAGFVPQVLATLDRTGANPKKLKLELTESMLVDNIQDVVAKMGECKATGIGFSLDDFGTGYSSLAYLKMLPLEQLKIDRSFVNDILHDVGSRAIAQSVISLGHALDLAVIAEGVETEEQRDFLKSLGCLLFQGYLFSRPLPLDQFELLWLNSASCTAPQTGVFDSLAVDVAGMPIWPSQDSSDAA